METTTKTQNLFRILLGLLLLFTGTGHLTFVRADFAGQVPDWVPLEKDLVVVLSGIVEILIGLGLLFVTKYRVAVGWIAAAFFIAIFPGNYAQYVNRVDAFGLNTDELRLTRLFLHPLLVIWPLWSTGAWSAMIKKKLV
ncbi:DoxX family membrane protein [Flavobacterium sp. Sd200]|uniref:DoxX family protein n=1 Tax=Flavobacterium sp. Sd200 TaxID=2692211 RepID=UPI00136A1ADC|nr:DoxX family membrane protein [Flavobacterium sp. Sd200]MXN92922.1 DoxX family membrane protein [Flavobacterium sp. Sd200]